MPLFMDRHEGLHGITPKEAAESHLQDLEVQGLYGVRYLSYWLDPEKGLVFCLADAPSAEAAERVHAESHGEVANRIIEVDESLVESFLGTIYEPAAGEAWPSASAFRVVAFTDIVGSTRLTQELGDAGAMTLLREHDEIVRSELDEHGGEEVKHTGDGIMASFTSVQRALAWGCAVQRAIAARDGEPGTRLEVRIGMSAGEPVAEGNDLFGAAVQLAARLCDRADPGSVLVASSVRDLALGKGYRFEAREPTSLKGFPEPVRSYAVAWTDRPASRGAEVPGREVAEDPL